MDLDVEEDIEHTLKSLGLEKGTYCFPIGLNEAGRRSIEGLVPEESKRTVLTDPSIKNYTMGGVIHSHA